MSTPTPPTTVLASCSFCGKDNTEVNKLIAGAGVYICDECVGLCTDILAAPSPAEEAVSRREAFENRSADQILAVLPSVARTAEAVESELRELVRRLRTADISWEDIAWRLGTDPEEARTRFER